MAKSKQIPRLLFREGQELDRQFYQRYNPDTLYNKVLALVYVLMKQEAFTEQIITFEDLKAERPDDKYFESLRAEIYFSEIHLFEALFALLLAYYKDQSDWLYLTTYTTNEFKTAVRAFLSGNIEAITNKQATSSRDFARQALYRGSVSTDEDMANKWDENLDNVCWLLQQWAERYIEGVEYNAYKHGLRVVTGSTLFTINLNNQFGSPQGPTFVIGASEDSLSFLELKEEQGRPTVYETTKHFNPRESFLNIDAMHLMLRTIKNTRLAALENNGEHPTLYTFFKLDKKLIMELRTRFTFRRSI